MPPGRGAHAAGARGRRRDRHLALSIGCARCRGAGAQRGCGARTGAAIGTATVPLLRAMKVLVLLLAVLCTAHAEDRVRIGSKRFTESYILGELLARASGGE